MKYLTVISNLGSDAELKIVRVPWRMAHCLAQAVGYFSEAALTRTERPFRGRKKCRRSKRRPGVRMARRREDCNLARGANPTAPEKDRASRKYRRALRHADHCEKKARETETKIQRLLKTGSHSKQSREGLAVLEHRLFGYRAFLGGPSYDDVVSIQISERLRANCADLGRFKPPLSLTRRVPAKKPAKISSVEKAKISRVPLVHKGHSFDPVKSGPNMQWLHCNSCRINFKVAQKKIGCLGPNKVACPECGTKKIARKRLPNFTDRV